MFAFWPLPWRWRILQLRLTTARDFLSSLLLIIEYELPICSSVMTKAPFKTSKGLRVGIRFRPVCERSWKIEAAECLVFLAEWSSSSLVSNYDSLLNRRNHTESMARFCLFHSVICVLTNETIDHFIPVVVLYCFHFEQFSKYWKTLETSWQFVISCFQRPCAVQKHNTSKKRFHLKQKPVQLHLKVSNIAC